MTDPINNPQPGDSVMAVVGCERVQRTMQDCTAFDGREYVEISFRDSRCRYVQFGSIKSWRAWCKKNKAEAVG